MLFLNYITKSLSTIFPKLVFTTTIENSYFSIFIRNTFIQKLEPFMGVLKFSSLFRLNTLVEYTAYDLPSSILRFTMILTLLSVEYNYRLLINFNTNTFIPSLSKLYFNASWCEREARDMFGIYFLNNLDLRRLLTDYGFEGFPLRKDFPLTGYFEVRYDDEVQHILYEPVQLSQEFRVFSISSPWEKKK